MHRLTPSDIDAFGQTSTRRGNCIRVGCDAGGIAAGANDVFAVLREERVTQKIDIEVLKTGPFGWCFADPVVAVEFDGMHPVIYGAVDMTVARRIVSEHCLEHRLIDDHIIATRQRATTLDNAGQAVILVKDTSPQGGDKTIFFQELLAAELSARGLADAVAVYRAFDMGLHDCGVCLQLLPSGVTYTHVLSSDVGRVVSSSIEGREVLHDLLHKEPDPQVRIVLRNCGRVDPEDLQDCLRHRAYQGLKRVLAELSPEEAIGEMKKSGLRGRGGAGFPTWLKLKLTRDPVADRKFVICNADEGDPGAFMDRSVLEGDPHSVLEGLILAGYCIGASKGYFYIRAEYPLAVNRVRRAIEDAREYGLLGERILGSDFTFDADVRLGAGAFVCGEETALIASIEGKRGSPSPRPPYPSVSGLWGKPTSINNVETLAAVSAIFDRGPAWYAGYGTEASPGTKVFAVTGKVKHSQLVEVPMGVPIRTIVYDICGGVLDDGDLKAVQTGGPSGGVIPEKLIDTPLSYENLVALGSIMGSGGMLVMDQNDSMIDVAKFYLKFCVDESCGKCAPCRVGGFQMLQILEKIFRGRGEESDIGHLHRICHTMRTASLCGLGQTAPNPVLSTLRYFSDEYSAFIEGGVTYARKMKKQLAEAGKKVS